MLIKGKGMSVRDVRYCNDTIQRHKLYLDNIPYNLMLFQYKRYRTLSDNRFTVSEIYKKISYTN